MRTLALAVCAAALVVACAGGTAPTPSSAAVTPSAQPRAATTPAAPTPGTAAAAATPAAPTAYLPQAGQAGTVAASEDLTFSGSIVGTMTKGTVISMLCGAGTVSGSGTSPGQTAAVNVPIAGTIAGATYVFGILISGQSKATGSFTTTDYWASFMGANANGTVIAVTLSSPDHTLNLTSLAGGTITVDAGGQSGTVKAAIDDRTPGAAAKKTVSVSGKWSCR